MQQLCVAQDCTELVAGIKAGLQGTIMAVSDGSYKEGFGTAAWTIRGTDQEQYISGRVRITTHHYSCLNLGRSGHAQPTLPQITFFLEILVVA